MHWAGRGLPTVDRTKGFGFAVPTITGAFNRPSVIMVGVVRPLRPTPGTRLDHLSQWPALVQQMGGAVARARHLAEELGESVGAVQQARCASQRYSAS
jgi:hypothetical protein